MDTTLKLFRVTILLFTVRVIPLYVPMIVGVILRAASTHYHVLENLLHHVNDAVRSSSRVDDIDEALCGGDFHALLELTKVDDFDTQFSNDVESSYEQCTGSADGDSMLRQPHLESQLLYTHAQLIPRLEKKIDDFPELRMTASEKVRYTSQAL